MTFVYKEKKCGYNSKWTVSKENLRQTEIILHTLSLKQNPPKNRKKKNQTNTKKKIKKNTHFTVYKKYTNYVKGRLKNGS